MSDPFKRGGCGSCNDDDCICFTSAVAENDVIKLFSDRGSLCFQAPIEAPLSGCLANIEGNGQALINEISTQLEALKGPQEDLIGVFAAGEVTGSGTIADPWAVVHPAGSDTTNSDLSLSGTTLTLTDSAGGTVSEDLAALLGTDDQTAAEIPTDATAFTLLTATDTQGNLEEIDACLVTLKAATDKFGPSAEPGNLLTAGAVDGLSYIDAAAINAVVAPHVPAVSADAGNVLTLGADGETFLDCSAVKGCETLTSISYDAATTSITYVDENGDSSVVNLAALAADIFVDGATFDASTGVLTLTDNDAGTPDITVNLGDLVSQVTNNADGTYTHTSGDGSVTQIVAVSGDANNSITVGSDGGAFFEHTPSSLTKLPDGNYTHDNGAGSIDTIDVGVQSVGDGGSNIVDNTDPINPVVRPLLGCDDAAIDVVGERFIKESDAFLRPVDVGCDIEWRDCRDNVVMTQAKSSFKSYNQQALFPFTDATNTLVPFNPAEDQGTALEIGTWDATGTIFTFTCAGIHQLEATTTLLLTGISVPVGTVNVGPTLISSRARFLFSGSATTGTPQKQEFIGPIVSGTNNKNMTITESFSATVLAAVGDTLSVNIFASSATPPNNFTLLRCAASRVEITRVGGFN